MAHPIPPFFSMCMCMLFLHSHHPNQVNPKAMQVMPSDRSQTSWKNLKSSQPSVSTLYQLLHLPHHECDGFAVLPPWPSCPEYQQLSLKIFLFPAVTAFISLPPSLLPTIRSQPFKTQIRLLHSPAQNPLMAPNS